MNYLENNICVFKNLTPIDYSIKKNIISTSLFKMRNGGYKNFNKYLNGIKVLNKVANDNDLVVRLFIDNTILDDTKIFNYLKSLNKIELIIYSCSKFFNNKYHIGLFGTLVRFFPLFDFENNDANVVYIADTDTKEEYITRLIKAYNILKKNNVDNKVYLSYNGRYFHKNILPSKIKNYAKIYNGKDLYLPYCIAQKIYGLKRIPKNSFVKFIVKLESILHTKQDKLLSDYYIDIKDYTIKCENNICFGIDEYYINKVLFRYLIINKLPFCYSNNYNISQFYYFKHPKIIDKRLLFNITFEEYTKIFNEYIDKIGLSNYTFETIDKEISVNCIKNATEFMKLYATKMTKLLIELCKKEDYRIYSRSQFYSMLKVDYNKYFAIRYMQFINIDINNIINNYILL